MKQTFSTLLIIFSVFLLGASDSRPEHLLTVTDLQATGQQAKENNLVLMLEFSSEYCPYCVRLEEEYLKPMQTNPDYDSKVMIRRIDIEGYANLIDFDGRPVSPAEFAGRYDAYVTPTLVFVSHDGKELADKLVGLGTEGFFAAYIDQHIAQARSKL